MIFNWAPQNWASLLFQKLSSLSQPSGQRGPGLGRQPCKITFFLALWKKWSRNKTYDLKIAKNLWFLFIGSSFFLFRSSSHWKIQSNVWKSPKQFRVQRPLIQKIRFENRVGENLLKKDHLPMQLINNSFFLLGMTNQKMHRSWS